MARTICTLRSIKALARRENPTSTPSEKPVSPPIASPAAARSSASALMMLAAPKHPATI
jgi:hypothetical protein